MDKAQQRTSMDKTERRMGEKWFKELGEKRFCVVVFFSI